MNRSASYIKKVLYLLSLKEKVPNESMYRGGVYATKNYSKPMV